MPADRPSRLVHARLRRIVTAIVVVVLATAVTAQRAEAYTPWQRQGYIAHAFGSPPTGEVYTNSREAFQESYRKGFRAFEVDLVRLKDGKVMAAHDKFEQRYGLPAGVRFSDVTYAEMKGRMLDGKWRALFGTDLLHLVKNHPDATFILDTKGDDLAIASWFVKYMAPSSLARLSPHVYSQSHLDGLRKIHHWTSVVLATYRWSASKVEDTAVSLILRNQLRTVMLHPRYHTPTIAARLWEAGARFLFLHSFTEAAEIQTRRESGWGVYSNGWIETDPSLSSVPAPPQI